MDSAQTTKNLAQKLAKQAVQEPLEMLKTARRQVGLEEELEPPQISSNQADKPEAGRDEEKLKENDKLRSTRTLTALENELLEIRRQHAFNEVQRKIANGEEVYLNNYPELSYEQKEVLLAQQTAIKAQKDTQANQKSLVEPSAKKGRKLFGFGQKGNVEKQQTHVERVQPPSG